MSNIMNTKVWIKVIISPSLLLLLGWYLNGQISLPNPYFYVGLGLIYALAAQILEMKYFKGHNPGFVTALDAVMAFGLIIVTGFSLKSSGAHVSLVGALIYTILQGGVEHLLHIWSRPVKKKWQRTKRKK